MPGMTCMSPRALADDRISAVKVDSCAISAETQIRIEALGLGVLLDQIPVVERIR